MSVSYSKTGRQNETKPVTPVCEALLFTVVAGNLPVGFAGCVARVPGNIHFLKTLKKKLL